MSLYYRILHGLVKGLGMRSYRQFLHNAHAPRHVQENILKKIVGKNVTCYYGQKYHFANIHDIDAYRKQVPVINYEKIADLVKRSAESSGHILTNDPIQLFEPTSGSSGVKKMIPYTHGLQQEYGRSISVWLSDLYTAVPEVMKGRHFWSISPSVPSREYTANGIPVGFESDTQYLGWAAGLQESLTVMPSWFREIAETREFLFVSAMQLLKSPDCTLISVWNPTYLILLLEIVCSHTESLLKAIHDGYKPVAGAGTQGRGSAPNTRRSTELEKIIASTDDRCGLYARLFPRLALVSCWMDAGCVDQARELRALLPNVKFQAKGLLSTEGIVSVPIEQAGGSAIAYTAHFLEFLSGKNHQSHLVDELEEGTVYRVCLTTSGGLYRYDTGDRIRVRGHYQSVPIVEFVGRDNVVDLVGEKLHEGAVRALLHEILDTAKLQAEFAMVAPERTRNGGYYVVYLELKNNWNDNSKPLAFIEKVEAGFRQNFHYAYARDLGQLEKVQLFLVRQGANRMFIERGIRAGQTIGNIKPAALDRRSGWAEMFDGDFYSLQKDNTA